MSRRVFVPGELVRHTPSRTLGIVLARQDHKEMFVWSTLGRNYTYFVLWSRTALDAGDCAPADVMNWMGGESLSAVFMACDKGCPRWLRRSIKKNGDY